MLSAIAPALIAAVTAVAVALLTSGLTARRERRAKAEDERQEHNKKYVNPLRISLAENLFRVVELRDRVESGQGAEALNSIREPSDISDKDVAWFNGSGAYLASSTYYAACVFSNIGRLRSELPYLRLRTSDDSLLLTKMRRVSIAYSKDLGIFFATQDSIGQMMRGAIGVRTYVEYCSFLTDGENGPWFHRLIQYYLDIGNARYVARVDKATSSMRELLEFFDDTAGAQSSIAAIRSAEQ